MKTRQFSTLAKVLLLVYGSIATFHIATNAMFDIAHGYGGNLIARTTGHAIGALLFGYILYSVIYFAFLRKRGPFAHLPPLIVSFILLISGITGNLVASGANSYLQHGFEVLTYMAAVIFLGVCFISYNMARDTGGSESVEEPAQASEPVEDTEGLVQATELVQKLDEPEHVKSVEEPIQEHQLASRLRVLQNLLNEGLISEDDYNDRKKEILAEL